jgi:hypothetical protein
MRLSSIAALVLTVGIVTISSAASPAPSSPEEALKQVIDQFTQAQVGFAPSVLRDLTTPEYIEVSPLGEVEPRDKMLGFYVPKQSSGTFGDHV